MQLNSGVPAVRAGRVPLLTVPGATLVRFLMYAGLLAGVLAMHGLTTGHDSAMVHLPTAPMVMSEPDAGEAAVAGHHSDHSVSVESGTAVSSAPSVSSSDSAQLSPTPDPMGAMCIAVLVGLLLVSLALKLVWLRSARPVRRTTSIVVAPSVMLGRAPPWLTPSLSKLCVLRT